MEAQVNIPIYRALKLGTKNEYIQGYYYKDGKYHIIFNGDGTTIFGLKVIDPSTLAVHFPGMIDSQGNKIFASLSKNGKGGDCTFIQNGYYETFIWDNLNACIVLKSPHYECKCFKNGSRNESTFNKYAIIGIQK